MNRPLELPAGVIPAGATHFYHDPSRSKPSTQAWRKQDGGKWSMFADGEWRVIKGSNAHMFVALEQVLRPVWEGEGLPPVGSTQHLEEEQRPVTILAHGISLGIPVAVCQDGQLITVALSQAFYSKTRENRIAHARELYETMMGESPTFTWDELQPAHQADYLRAIDAGYAKP